MSVTPDQIAWAEELLEPVGGLSTRRMMGGASFYSHGRIFAILSSEGRIYLKAEGEMAERLRGLGGETFSMVRKNGTVGRMGYVSLTEEVLDEPDRVVDLAREALEALDAPR